MDLQNGVYEEDALVKLNEWEQRAGALLEGGTGKTKFRIDPTSQSSVSDGDDEVQEEEANAGRQSYADMFK